jgi:hypothetical protein
MGVSLVIGVTGYTVLIGTLKAGNYISWYAAFGFVLSMVGFGSSIVSKAPARRRRAALLRLLRVQAYTPDVGDIPEDYVSEFRAALQEFARLGDDTTQFYLERELKPILERRLADGTKEMSAERYVQRDLFILRVARALDALGGRKRADAAKGVTIRA